MSFKLKATDSLTSNSFCLKIFAQSSMWAQGLHVFSGLS